jgi:hypothetical protein
VWHRAHSPRPASTHTTTRRTVQGPDPLARRPCETLSGNLEPLFNPGVSKESPRRRASTGRTCPTPSTAPLSTTANLGVGGRRPPRRARRFRPGSASPSGGSGGGQWRQWRWSVEAVAVVSGGSGGGQWRQWRTTAASAALRICAQPSASVRRDARSASRPVRLAPRAGLPALHRAGPN